MGAGAMNNIPPPPAGFEMMPNIPPPPAGFEMMPPMEVRSEPLTLEQLYPSGSPMDVMAGEKPATMREASDFAEKVGQGFFANYGDELAATAGALPNILTGGYVGRGRQEILDELRGREKQFDREHPTASTIGELSGAIGSAAGTGVSGFGLLGQAPGALRSMGIGALLSGAQGGVDATGRMEGSHDLGDYASTAAKGSVVPGVVGGITGGVAGSLGRMLSPDVDPLAQRLLDRGIDLTPGEIVGGYGKRMEDIATSTPFVGRQVVARQEEAIESMNRAAWDDALTPIRGQGAGAQMPLAAEMGHDAQAEARHIFNRRYGAVVPRMTAYFDQPFANEVRRVSGTLPQNIRPQYAEAFRRHIQDNLQNGWLNGRAIQDTIQGLRREARNLRRNPGNAYDIDLAQALDHTRDAVETAAARYTHPRTMGDFRRINEAYRNYVVLRDAGSRVSSEGGIFSPSALHNAVRSADDTTGHGAFARGEAPMQELSDAAKTVMMRRVNDSGTPERAAILGAVAAPWSVIPGIAAASPIAALYSGPGSAGFRHMARLSPQTKAQIRRIAARIGVTAGTENEAMRRD